MRRSKVRSYLIMSLIVFSLALHTSALLGVSLNPFRNLNGEIIPYQSDSIRVSQNAIWNDYAYFEWAEGGSIVSWKVDDNGNRDPRDDVDLIRGAPVGNSIDLGWTGPNHDEDHTFYTTGTNTDRGYHSATDNAISQVIDNGVSGSVLIRGDLGPNARFQIRYTLQINDPALYAQVAIDWTRATVIGFVGFGVYASYSSLLQAPNRFILGNTTEYLINELPSFSGWFVGHNPLARYAAFRNSNTGRIIGMAANTPGIFEISGDADQPWGRGLTHFFKYRGEFSQVQPSYRNEFKFFSDNTNSYQAFLIHRTVFPSTSPLSISFVSPLEEATIRETVRIRIKVNSNVVVKRVTLLMMSQRIAITSNYDLSNGYYYYDWDTSQIPNGAYTLTAEVIDIAGNQGVNRLHLSVANISVFTWAVLILSFTGVLAFSFYYYRWSVHVTHQRQTETQMQQQKMAEQKQRELEQQQKIAEQKQRELELEQTGRLKELIDFAKHEILNFKDQAEQYAVSQAFIQQTIQTFISKGTLWGITTASDFVSVEFAISTLKRLSKVYSKIKWQSLMEEFKLTSENDLKVLLMQISHSDEVSLLIDEVETSVQLKAIETSKPLKPAIRSIPCPNCGSSLDSKASHCEQCGEEFPQCIICHLPILSDFTKTPCCGSAAHSRHLKEWLKIKNSCPICKEKIREEWVL